MKFIGFSFSILICSVLVSFLRWSVLTSGLTYSLVLYFLFSFLVIILGSNSYLLYKLSEMCALGRFKISRDTLCLCFSDILLSCMICSIDLSLLVECSTSNDFLSWLLWILLMIGRKYIYLELMNFFSFFIFHLNIINWKISHIKKYKSFVINAQYPQ